MKKFLKAASALQFAVLLGLSATAVAADRQQDGRKPHHKWWQSEEVKTELGLTAQQSGQIEEIFQGTLPRLRAAKEELDRHEKSLSKALADPAASESQVTHQIDKVESARAELGKLRTLMLFRMHRVLSPEQREKLKAHYERRAREHERRPSSERCF